MSQLLRLFASPLILAAALVQTTEAVEINHPRAEYNYQMHCRGCHTPDGTGGKDVPKIKDFMGHFLSTQEGREYLVRVPGSANASLDDTQLAEVLNWMLLELGGASMPENGQLYSAAEVHELRKNPLFEVVEYRRQLISKMALDNLSD